jgi:F0F1-type ATP synthase epsilon subunit
MSVLKPGVLLYRGKDGEKKFLAIGDGILQIARSQGDDTILVLVDRGEKGGEIDREAAQQELAALESEISKAKPDTLAENYLLTNQRAWVAARVEAATRSH